MILIKVRKINYENFERHINKGIYKIANYIKMPDSSGGAQIAANFVTS